MALVMVLVALVILLGCGALACRWEMADRGSARYIHDASQTGSRQPEADKLRRI